MKNLFLLLFITVSCVFATLFISCNSKKRMPGISLSNNQLYLFVGSYSDETTPGISLYNFETQTGDFEYLSEIHGILNPSYLAVSPERTCLYSVNETPDGAISSFAFDKTSGTLSWINSQPTIGGAPCFVAIDSRQTTLITANYSGGSLSVFPLKKQGNIGNISQHIFFSPQSHIHTAMLSPDESYLLATDLGKDKIYVLRLASNGSNIYLIREDDKTIALEAGSGPRHLAFHPNKDFMYCINELSGKITVFNFHDGFFSPVQSIASDTIAETRVKGSADIHLTPDGKYLYASNRLAADGIAIFSVHSENGRLQRLGYQKTGIHPRNFIISPNGKFLLCANKDSHTVQIFEINPHSGLLKDTGKAISVLHPVCLKWMKK